MKKALKFMNTLTTVAYWLMVITLPLLAIGAVVRIFTGSMNRQAGAHFMLVGGIIIGSMMFLFLILKIITSLMEESVKDKAEPEETPSDS